MQKLTAKLMQKTQKIVKPFGVTLDDHWYHIFTDYINQSVDVGYHTSTISRVMSGKALLPWAMVRYYAGHGTRCPEALVDNLRAYMSDHYWDRQRREALRMAIMDVLDMLPSEDQEDICDYWDSGDLAHRWAVMLWYCITNDYAATTWLV